MPEVTDARVRLSEIRIIGACSQGADKRVDVNDTTMTQTEPIALNGPAFFSDPYPTYSRLRESNELIYDDTLHSWLITRFADVESVLRDPRIIMKIQRVTGSAFETSAVFRDGAEHSRIRGLLNQVFANLPENLEQTVLRVADSLIDRMKEGRKADFLRDFAVPLPVTVISEVLGLPASDTARLHAWSSDYILDEGVSQTESDQRQWAAICGMDEYFRSFVATGGGNGMIGALLRAERGGEKLSIEELVGNFILLMIAGHETTVNLLGNGLYLLLQQPERMERVRRDPKVLPTTIDEILRYESPVQLATYRVTTETLDIGGQTLEAGSFITAMLGAANRDPRVFADADVFDMARTPNRHLAFGFGPHRCIGAQLARTESRIGFARLAERLPNLALDTVPKSWMAGALKRIGLGSEEKPIQPHWRPRLLTRGLTELKISL